MTTKINFLLLVSVLWLFSSCVSHKNISILNDVKSEEFSCLNEPYQIQKGDVININVDISSSSNHDLFQEGIDSRVPSYSMSEIGAFLSGYVVNDSGSVYLPLIGETFVEGKTIKEVEESVRKEVELYNNFVTVKVKLLSFRITVLGEVNRPGTFLVPNSGMSLLQAIGQVGDITDYGDRGSVLLLRKYGNTIKTFEINLKDKSFLNSEIYMLKPNDVIYVNPQKQKQWKVNLPAIQSVISLTTLLILILNYTTK